MSYESTAQILGRLAIKHVVYPDADRSEVAWTERVEKAPPFFTLRDAEARRSRRGWWRRVDNALLVHALLPDGDALVKGPIILLPLFAGSSCRTVAARSLTHKVT